jgi:hypothetical protein
MARDRHAADIPHGSAWCDPQGVCVIVRSVSGGLITFTDEDGAVDMLHVNRFRDRYTDAPYDAKRVRSQFSMSVANLESFHAFWSDSAKKMYARGAAEPPERVRTAARGRPALPLDAEYVGTYSGRVVVPPWWNRQRLLKSVDAFFEDLNDLIARKKSLVAP